MIYGNVRHLEEFKFLEQAVRESLVYAQSHDLSGLEKGRHDIDGDTLYFNIAEYTTAPSKEKAYEAHRAYIDVHYMIRGEEKIEIAFVSNMAQGEYEAEGDYLPVSGEATASAVMRAGDFLVCYPADGHKPGIQVDAPSDIKKAIFKVALR